MNSLKGKYLGLLATAAAASCAIAMPAHAALVADGITYTLLQDTTGLLTDSYTLTITGINAPSDTEGGRYGVASFAFNQPTGYVSATQPAGWSYTLGGLAASGCNGTGNFFCFTNPSPGTTALPAGSSRSYNFSVTASSAADLTSWNPDFKIDWVGSNTHYDLVSLALAPQAAPEIDSASALGALTLLGGSLVVMLNRRRKA